MVFYYVYRTVVSFFIEKAELKTILKKENIPYELKNVFEEVIEESEEYDPE